MEALGSEGETCQVQAHIETWNHWEYGSVSKHNLNLLVANHSKHTPD